VDPVVEGVELLDPDEAGGAEVAPVPAGWFAGAAAGGVVVGLGAGEGDEAVLSSLDVVLSSLVAVSEAFASVGGFILSE
jgi:hypothetical protein